MKLKDSTPLLEEEVGLLFNMTEALRIYGPNTYSKVKEQIETDNLITPTFSELISLVHTVFNSDDKYREEINRLVVKSRLWGFTGILYIPNKGAYIQDNPEIKNDRPFMEESDLERRLEANDPSVRHVPFGYKIWQMKSSELAKNPFVIALANGEENAEKLAEFADKHKFDPHLWSYNPVRFSKIRVAALYSYSGHFLGQKLHVDCGYYGYNGDEYGYAVVIERTGEANQVKK